MSATRVESPLCPEFRRQQPSPHFAVATMPKPRACRKLFQVDPAETNRFLREQKAEIERQQREEFGFDFDSFKPLPDQDSSRYTDWEPVPEDEVPSFYRETGARRKPIKQCPKSSSHHHSSNNGSTRSGLANSSPVIKDIQAVPSRIQTGSPHSFAVVHPEDVRQVPAKTTSTSTSLNSTRPRETTIQPVLLEQASVSDKPSQCDSVSEVCPGVRDNNEQTKGTATSTPVKNAPTSLPAQSKITDFWRQRKRQGSDCSSTSSSSTEEGKLRTKRRRSSGTSSGEESLPIAGHS